MTQQSKKHIRAGLLIAAAALPFSPLPAQDTQPPPQTSTQPVIDITPPPATQTAPPPAATSTPAPSTAPPAEADVAETTVDAVEAAPVSTAARSSTRTTATARRTFAPRAATADPAPARAEPAPAPAVESLSPAEPVPGLVPEAVTPLEETVADEAQAESVNPSEAWPWVVGGLLLVGALGLLIALRRRRRMDEYGYDEIYEEAAVPVSTTPEPVTAAVVPGVAAVEAATLVRRVERDHGVAGAEPAAGDPAPIAAELPGAPVAAAPVAAALAGGGRPKLELKVRPVRAGVVDRAATVDFHLQILNAGSGPARDVAISSWMYAAGDGEPSEAERRLIEHPANMTIEEIGAGESRRVQSNARLAVSGIEGDSILPVIVVDITYRHGDELEGHASSSFAVGVPLDGDLAHFDLENPSGLHEGVEARPLNVLQRA
jgi:hypothetical protein